MLNSWIFDGELHDHYHEVYIIIVVKKLYSYCLTQYSLYGVSHLKDTIHLLKDTNLTIKESPSKSLETEYGAI